MSLLIDNIGSLVTNDPAWGGLLGVIPDAAVVVEEQRSGSGTAVGAGSRSLSQGSGRIAWVGPRAEAPDADERLDAEGRAVLPGFVESHSHLVFAGERAEEFAARMAGQKYAAGGIRSTLAATRAASDAELSANVTRLVGEYLRQGTTTVEIKSGYGQSVLDEHRSLEVAGGQSPFTTLLAAHVTPPEYAGRVDDYVAMVIDEMIPACAPLASWIDVFCEQGAFDEDQSRAVLTAGKAAGLGVRMHGNQLHQGPGIQLAVELGAASVDHVCHTDDADVAALAASETVATLLPAADFSTRNKYPDARRLWDAGVTVALGADCNPGTSYTTSMPFVIALAVRDLHLTPAEAVWAATAGGAQALQRDDIGVLRPGAIADLVVLDAPSHLHLAYRPGVPLVHSVMKAGALR
ncbi:MAG: imidazolonepropionase [Micropruina sp.]|uniref:imidazolonepropionase n=1 Tax=Micropruina sp. TaxID=2737536 RepID=UPI0039E5EE31